MYLAYNLFNITLALENGCEMEGSNQMIKIKKGRQEYIFDHRTKNEKGILYGIHIVERTNKKQMKASRDYLMLNMDEIHAKLGHQIAKITKVTVSKLNFKAKGCHKSR